MKTKNVLANKNFTLLFVGALCSNIGQIFYTFAVGLYVLKISDSSFIHGIYLASSGIVFLLGTPIGGFLADRLNKARIVYLTDYMRGGLIIASGYIMFVINNVSVQLVVLFVTAVFLNILSAVFNPAAASLIRFIVTDDQLQQAQSYYGVLNSVQNIIGVLLASILYSFISIWLLFIIVGVLYVLSGFSEMFIRYNYQKSESAVTIKTMISDYGEGLRYLRGQKALLVMILGVLFINFFFSPIFSNGTPYFVTYYIKGDYLFSEFVKSEMWKAIFTCSVSLGTLIISIVLGIKSDKGEYGVRVRRWLFILALVLALIPISYYALIVINDKLDLFLITFTVVAFLIGIVTPNVNIPAGVAIQKSVERDKLAKVQSLLTIGSLGLTPFASFIGGAVIEKLGLGPLFIICAAGILFTSIFISANKNIETLGIVDNTKNDNLIDEVTV